MAIRVRKLAKELNRSPADVIGLLIAIGFPRYRTSEDMVPDELIDRLKRAIRDGVKPAAVQLQESERPQPLPTRAARPDLMSQLVPGVVPVGRPSKPRAEHAVLAAKPLTAPPKPAAPDPASPAAPDTAAAIAALEAARGALTAEVETLQAERAALAAERARISEQRAALDHALTVARDATPQAPAADGVTLHDLLIRRGLRGRDEFERAIAALASQRMCGDLLTMLIASDVPAVELILRERLVFAQSETSPVPTGVAAVIVGAERAEATDAVDLQRTLVKLGERLLLHGLRRVAVIGGRPSLHKQLREGVDGRIELRFSPPTVRARSDAEADVQRTDLVVLWAVAAAPEAREIYASSRAIVVEVTPLDLTAFVSRVEAALDAV
jgi:hypothetical protein